MIVTVKKIGINGEGIGYYKKKPIFIDGCLPDEIVEFEILKQHDNYIEGKLLKILKKSNKRVKPECNYYNFCGGCQLMHTDYKNQLKIKKDLFLQTLEKYTKINSDIVSDVVASTDIFNYRHELKLPVTVFNNRLYAGMYLKKSNSLKRINTCIIHKEDLEAIKDEVLKVLNDFNIKAYNSKNPEGLRYILLRSLNFKYQLQLIFGKKNKSANLISALKKIQNLTSIYFSYNTKSDPLINRVDAELVYGQDELILNIDKYNFVVKNNSFLQLNLNQAKNIFEYIDSLIKPCDFLVETYAGIGMMSILFNEKAKEIEASELNPSSIESFEASLKLNNINNIKVSISDAYQHLRVIDRQIDYLIVDPPRSGLDHKMIEEIMKKDIKNIIYMSCSPSSLCKNLEVLKKKYSIRSIKLFDMFTNTAHLESVCFLERK